MVKEKNSLNCDLETRRTVYYQIREKNQMFISLSELTLPYLFVLCEAIIYDFFYLPPPFFFQISRIVRMIRVETAAPVEMKLEDILASA